jgi:hypothetical protein
MPLFVTGLVKNNINLVNGTAHLRRLWAIWRIAELLRLGRVPATAEDFALLDEILPADRDRTHSILLNLKTEVRLVLRLELLLYIVTIGSTAGLCILLTSFVLSQCRQVTSDRD